MMRRPSIRLRELGLAVALAVVSMALAIWIFRPGPIRFWLNAGGIGGEGTPVSIAVEWAAGDTAPMSLFGFLSAFPILDVGTFLALLIALGVIIGMLFVSWRDSRSESTRSGTLTPTRAPGFRLKLRTLLILIAVVALDLGWEVVEWRSWPKRRVFKYSALAAANVEVECERSLRSVDSSLRALLAGEPMPGADILTPSARAAHRAHRIDELKQERLYWKYQADGARARRQRLALAARNPLRPLEDDPPTIAPEYPLPAGFSALNRGDYESALAELERESQTYGDYVPAIERRAWILATCPIAKLRDGTLAVTLATHAAELTNWKSSQVLSTLAAAHAERGDFTAATRWQQRALELSPPIPGDHDRLLLYQAGKPFRSSQRDR